MTSPGRYQSRLFNLFSRQSRRLTDRFAVQFRQAKMAATWGAQILLYPVYALFQTTRLVGRQIKQTVQQVLPQLQAAEQAIERVRKPEHPPSPTTADTPIQHVLAAVESFALPVAIQPLLLTAAQSADAQTVALTIAPPSHLTAPDHSPQAIQTPATGSECSPVKTPASQIQPNQVRGIASLIETHKLVLTTVGNQILDIFTPQQQSQLQQRIVWELADYWRSRRQTRLKPRSVQASLPTALPPLSPHQTHLLPPVRWFRQLMVWIQTSPVAIAANLFQESALLEMGFSELEIPASAVPLTFAEATGRSPLLLTAAPIAAFSTPTLPLNPAFPAIEGAELPSAAEPFLSYPPQPSRPWKHWLGQVLQALDPQPLIPDESLAVEGLAADGFMATDGESALVLMSPADLVPQRPLMIKQRSRQPKRDKRDNPHSAQTRKPAIAVKGYQTTALPAANSPHTPPIIHSQVTCSPDITVLPETAIESSKRPVPTVANDASVELEVRDAEKHMPTAAPSWIETEATLVGYVKHPLEQLLEWLDSGMLWLESLIIKILSWMHRR
jgi:hypothetical protein